MVAFLLPSLPAHIQLRSFLTLFDRRTTALICGPPPLVWIGPETGIGSTGIIWRTAQGWRPVLGIPPATWDLLWQERLEPANRARWAVTPSPRIHHGLLGSPSTLTPGEAKRQALAVDDDG